MRAVRLSNLNLELEWRNAMWHICMHASKHTRPLIEVELRGAPMYHIHYQCTIYLPHALIGMFAASCCVLTILPYDVLHMT